MLLDSRRMQDFFYFYLFLSMVVRQDYRHDHWWVFILFLNDHV
jgi:hypothetical protein